MMMVAWAIASVASIVLMLRLRQMDMLLWSPETPRGIVGFELAATRERATLMLQAWRGLGVVELVRDSLRLDFGFLLVYPVSLGLACRILSRRMAGVYDRVGARLSFAVLACTPLDAVENLSLLRMLERGASETMARLAAVSAVLKFVLVLAAVVFVLGALVRAASHRMRTGSA
jgi:hypothetical protein